MTVGDDDFRIKPGKIGNRGAGRVKPQSFAMQVKRAAARSGFVHHARSRGGTGLLGRGRGAALRGRRSPATRRVIVKARPVRHGGQRVGRAPLGRHIAYLERDGVTRDGRDASLFDARSDQADRGAFAERCADDRHHFRVIVSPEDASELADLRTFTRELMDDVARDLDTRLDWVAVDHWNTDNPHIHVLVRGVTDGGADLVIDRNYISHGMRDRAEARATLELGPRSAREIEQALDSEIKADRWTRLDQTLVARADRDGMVDLRREADMTPARGDLRLIGRAQKLERLGIAVPQGSARWTLKPDLEVRLRELGDRGDIIRTMHRAMRKAGHAIHEGRLAIHPPGATAPFIGRLVARGLQDGISDTAYAIIDGTDGQHHHLRLDAIDLTTDAGPGAIVELRSWHGGGGARRELVVHSDLPLERQVTAGGATWLDRQLLEPSVEASEHGFGGEVREAIAVRRQHLVDAGLATRHGGRVTLNPTLIDTLRAADLSAATARIAERTGLIVYETKPGATIVGTYRERVTLASGRFAMIDDGLGFQLVPWRPELEKSLGSSVTGTTATDGGIGWTLGRRRGLGI